MDNIVILLVGALSGVLLAVLFNAIGAKGRVGELEERLSLLSAEVRLLKRQLDPAKPQRQAPAMPVKEMPPKLGSLPPPVPVSARPEPAFTQPVPVPVTPPLNWEQFMGAKLFAWIGGLAFFLGIAFFLKYSFEHNLIPPEMRAAIGFLVGICLVGGGILLKSKESAVTSQTLCGTGLLVLYAVTFACRAYYHFAFFGLIPTLLLMTLITALAFVLAVRLDAVAVAILGVAGGFLTPVLLDTGQDNPAVLFAYVALLDIGLLAIAHRQRWSALPILGAVGTILLQAAWVGTFFVRERYFAGDKVLVAMAVFAGFEALFLAASALAASSGKGGRAFHAAGVALAVAAMGSAFYFLSFEVLGVRPALLCGYVFLLDLGFLYPPFIAGEMAAIETFGGAIVFLFLGAWSWEYLTPGRLHTALGFYFVLAIFHAVSPLSVGRNRLKERFWAASAPFLLLILVTFLLPLKNPSPVFAVALALVLLLLGITRVLSWGWLPVAGLASVILLEHAWYFLQKPPLPAGTPLVWLLVFYGVFTVFPFVGRSPEKIGNWTASALAGPLEFYLIYHLFRAACPDVMPGLVPAAFAVPPLVGLFLIVKRARWDSPIRYAQLAVFGGSALFFITTIFAVQFDKEWITIGWALEGAALCWLFLRVPHKGLRIVGTGLLIVAFARLALNPSVLGYHPRAATPIFNWYLYTYGLVTVSLFAGARFLAPPRNEVLGVDVPAWLYTLGTLLAFLLLNIEIADYFSTPGAAHLTFEFSGNFARDMSYSIAWALFALVLLIAGIRVKSAPVRYGGLGLLGITLLKLFLHDLSELDQLYRIGALIAVAIIAILASFLYQRFLGRESSVG